MIPMACEDWLVRFFHAHGAMHVEFKSLARTSRSDWLQHVKTWWPAQPGAYANKQTKSRHQGDDTNKQMPPMLRDQLQAGDQA